MGYLGRRIRAIASIVCALGFGMMPTWVQAGLVSDPPPSTPAIDFYSAQSYVRSPQFDPSGEALAAPARTVAQQDAEIAFAAPTSSAPTSFFDAAASPGTVIPLPPTVWTGLLLLGGLGAIATVRTIRR